MHVNSTKSNKTITYTTMEIIKNQEFGGERPLFASHDLRLENVTIHAGESALKQCSNIEAIDCRFEGKYPFWHVKDFKIEKCLFTEGARAALWYSQDLEMKDTLVEAPKMFREMKNLKLERVRIPNALETLWHCENIEMNEVELEHGDYLMMHGRNIVITNYKHQGNYAFQYCKNMVIHNAVIDSKDAFWNTENVTVYDSVINGEYLGWHSKRLKLIGCRISGTQPLCYCKDLKMEMCEFTPDADLAFEDSSVKATLLGDVTSIKNPMTGKITLHGGKVKDLIIDKNIKEPGNCIIVEY